MLLCGVPTRNSAPIPISTRNRNSTRVGAIECVINEKKSIIQRPIQKLIALQITKHNT